MAKYCLLVSSIILSLVSCGSCEQQGDTVIYVDTINGVNDTTCWFRGIHLPCKSMSLAAIGKQHNPHSVIAVLENSLQHHKFIQLNKTVSHQNCYPWMFYNETSEECECSDIPDRAILCDLTIPRTSILDCYCMTYNSELSETQLGKCFFGCEHMDTLYNALPNATYISNLTKLTCEKAGRTSTLCGKCKPGLSPLVYSYEMYCVNCTNMTYNWIKYIAAAYIPLTIFFFIVVVFKLQGTNPWMRAFITICQGQASPIVIRSLLLIAKKRLKLSIAIRVLGLIYGVFNLDFFRTVLPPICLDITPIQALALDYAVAFYPFLLVFITFILIKLHSRDVRIVVWLWRLFHKCFGSIKKNWDSEGSVANAFATFFLLSYLKLLDVSFDLLIYTEIYTLNNNSSSYSVRYGLYYDASIEYFGTEHLPYAVLALFVMIFVILLPIIFLIIYPMRCCQRCLNLCHVQRHSLNIWVNCYQGYYKDGTNGTRDYRFFSVLFFLIQITMFIFFMLSRNSYCYSICAVFLTCVTAVQVLVQPYKQQFHRCNLTDVFLMLNFTSILIMTTAADEADIRLSSFIDFSSVMCGVLAVVPLVYLAVLAIHWFITKKILAKCFVRLMKSKQEYTDRQLVNSDSDLPHRVENSLDYEAQHSICLLDKQGQHNDYGTHH